MDPNTSGFRASITYLSDNAESTNFTSPAKFVSALEDSSDLPVETIVLTLLKKCDPATLTELEESFNTEIVFKFLDKTEVCLRKGKKLVEKFQFINKLIKAGKKFKLLRILDWKPHIEELDALVAELSADDIINLPSLALSILERKERGCGGFAVLTRFLAYGWRIQWFDFTADFTNSQECDWLELGRLMSRSEFEAELTHSYRKKSKIESVEEYVDFREIIQVFSKHTAPTTLKRFENIAEATWSSFFEKKSMRWRNMNAGAIRTLEIVGLAKDRYHINQKDTNQFRQVEMRGSVCKLIGPVDELRREVVDRLPQLIRKDGPCLVECLNLYFADTSQAIAKKLLLSLSEVNHDVFCILLTCSIRNKGDLTMPIPRILQKQLEDNLAKKMVEWTESGTEVRYGRMKLMVIGNGQAGKTTTIRSLLGMKFNPKIESTVVAAAETDVSIDVKDVSFSRWQEVNIGTRWVADEMSDYFHRLRNNQEVIKDSVLPGKQQTEQVTLKGIGEQADDSIEQVWLEKPSLAKITQQRKQQMHLKKRAKGFLGKAMKVANVKKLGKEKLLGKSEPKDTLGKDNGRLTIWDFGGQEVFYALHHLYLTTGGLYVLIFNLKQLKDNLKPELDILEFWLESVSLHAGGSGVILVGTRCNEVNPDDLVEINNALLEALEGKEVEVHYSNEFCFHPIDNSDKQNIQSKLQPLKNKINYCFQAGERAQKHVWQKKISLSWMYFMHYLVTNFPGMISSNKLIQAGESMNLNKERDIIPMLNFYKNAGAIIPFMKSGHNKEPETSDYIVLSPDWLLGALGCFIYDPRLHRKNQQTYGKQRNERDLLQNYERTGIIPARFLSQILDDSGFSEKERDFLIGICKEMLLISKYEFNLEDGGAHWLVPSMNRSFASADRILLEAAPEDCLNIYIHWGRYIPHGLFERVICVMLLCNEAYGGSVIPPVIFSNFCGFYFRETQVFISNERQNGDFRIAVNKSDLTEDETTNLLINVLTIIEEVVGMLKLDILGKELDSEIQIEVDISKPPSKVRCGWNKLRETIAENGEKVVSSVAELGKKLKPIVLFEPFTSATRMMIERSLKEEQFNTKIRQQEVETVLEAIVYEVEEDILADGANSNHELHTPINHLEWEWNCFMAHTWGPDNGTHKQVLEIRNKLEERNIRTWTDEYNLKQYISFDVVRGLRKSSCVLVFVTQLYLEKVNNPDTHVAREFKHAILRGSSYLVPVILEESCLEPKTWLGSSAAYHIQDSIYYDLSSEEKFAENFDKLVLRINEYSSRARLPNSYDTPPLERVD